MGRHRNNAIILRIVLLAGVVHQIDRNQALRRVFGEKRKRNAAAAAAAASDNHDGGIVRKGP